MPPHEAAEVQVAQLVELEAPVAEAVEPAAAALLDVLAALELLLELLLQPAASKIDPTAATAATIALDARK